MRTTWDDVGRCGTTKVNVGQRGTTWANVGRCGTTWDDVGQHGTMWDDVGRGGTTWDDVGQRGTMWDKEWCNTHLLILLKAVLAILNLLIWHMTLLVTVVERRLAPSFIAVVPSSAHDLRVSCKVFCWCTNWVKVLHFECVHCVEYISLKSSRNC